MNVVTSRRYQTPNYGHILDVKLTVHNFRNYSLLSDLGLLSDPYNQSHPT